MFKEKTIFVSGKGKRLFLQQQQQQQQNGFQVNAQSLAW